ncbi:SRPBCC family protein [Ferruginibacter sp.]|nr:SRPBCC family protein [Ferruginibacter sp.]
MEQTKTVITISATINAPIEKVWKCWTSPEDIMQWNQASPDWHCPASAVDLKIGGKFSATMAAKDGSFAFDFWGTYDDILENELLMVTMGDGRKWKTTFASNGDVTEVVESFEAENQNPIEMQQGGWQAILNSFKAHTEKI